MFETFLSRLISIIRNAESFISIEAVALREAVNALAIGETGPLKIDSGFFERVDERGSLFESLR